MILRAAIFAHGTITLLAEFLDRVGELRRIHAQVEQATHIGHEGVDRGRILGVLQIVRRLPHEADVPDSHSLRGVEENRGNAGRAFVRRPTINAPRLEQRPRGGVAASARDTYWPRMRSP